MIIPIFLALGGGKVLIPFFFGILAFAWLCGIISLIFGTIKKRGTASSEGMVAGLVGCGISGLFVFLFGASQVRRLGLGLGDLIWLLPPLLNVLGLILSARKRSPDGSVTGKRSNQQ